MAQEERIYDEYLLRRLTRAEADGILAHDIWPADFQTYEAVLRVAAQRGKRACVFLDPNAYSLVETVAELWRDRAGITDIEIGALIGIDARHVARLATPPNWLRRLLRRALA